jgi:hypothetical protein
MKVSVLLPSHGREIGPPCHGTSKKDCPHKLPVEEMDYLGQTHLTLTSNP